MNINEVAERITVFELLREKIEKNEANAYKIIFLDHLFLLKPDSSG